MDEEILEAAKFNNTVVVSNWLLDLPKELDVSTRNKLVQILKQASQCLSEDVITKFIPPSKYIFAYYILYLSWLFTALPKDILAEIINTSDTDGMVHACVATYFI